MNFMKEGISLKNKDEKEIIELPYFNKFVEVPSEIGNEKIQYQELNVEELARNFEQFKPTQGRKIAKTIVIRARGGENIVTYNNKGEIETSYTVKKDGTCIFANTPDGKYDPNTVYNPTDIYVPRDKNEIEWDFDTLLSRNYKAVRDEHPKVVGYEEYKNIVLVESTETFPILHEAIKKPTVIVDSEGKKLFYLPGATITLNKGNKISLIDKDAFDNTWEVVSNKTQGKDEEIRT